MQPKGLILQLLLSAALIYAQISTTKADQMDNRDMDLRLVEPLYHFTNKLFRQIRKEKENIVVSPISIHSALNMVLMGAKSGSVTERELIETLGYTGLNGTLVEAYVSYAKLLANFRQLNKAALEAKQNPPTSSLRSRRIDKRTELDVWNMAILKNGDPLPTYLGDVQTYQSSAVKRIRDDKPEEKRQLVESINQWAKEAGFDDKVIKKDDLDAKFSILLLSAIKVQGYWFQEFNEHDAKDVFYNHGKKLVKSARCLSDRDLRGSRYLEFTKKQPSNQRQARLSANEQRAIEELAGPGFYAVEIPLKDKLSFTIFEPLTNGSGDALAKLEDHLLEVDSSGNQFKLHRALQLLDNKEHPDLIEYIQFPKFKFESDINLEDPLKSIGLTRIFSRDAELSRMSQASGMVVDKVKHQAVIEVNKLGIKGAGITSVRVVPLSLLISADPIRLLIKHPFMFVVRYDKVPLFIGHLVQV